MTSNNSPSMPAPSLDRGTLEIVGFWTPEYLRKKWQTLTLIAGRPILVAVAAKLEALAAECGPVPPNVMTYGTRLKIAPVMARLNAMRDRGR
jgi:predicted nuclease of restriction endonuclease-like RecB superfamily